MCGKFTAMYSRREVFAFSQPLDGGPRYDGTDSNDEVVTYRPMANVPVIIFDHEAGHRRIVPMRWGFPDWKNPKIPKPIHAGSETIGTTPAFRSAFKVRPCLVVADGFYEWKKITPKEKQPYLITRAGGNSQWLTQMTPLDGSEIPG